MIDEGRKHKGARGREMLKVLLTLQALEHQYSCVSASTPAKPSITPFPHMCAEPYRNTSDKNKLKSVENIVT